MLEINHAILVSEFDKETRRIQIKQYCYQGCMKRQEGFQINQYCYQGSGLYEETGRVADKPILLSGFWVV